MGSLARKDSHFCRLIISWLLETGGLFQIYWIFSITYCTDAKCRCLKVQWSFSKIFEFVSFPHTFSIFLYVIQLIKYLFFYINININISTYTGYKYKKERVEQE